VGASQPSQPAEQLPSARLVEKIAFSNCFGSIGKGVQTHDFGAVGSQLCQYLFVVFPDERRLNVQIHLAEIPTLFFQTGGNLGTVFVPEGLLPASIAAFAWAARIFANSY